MKGAKVFVDTTGIKRAIARATHLSAKKVEQVQQRAKSTLTRRLRAEAARQVSQHQLNLQPRQISPFIQIKHGSTSAGDYVAVTASNERLPLTAFRPKVSKRNGVTVQTWRDGPIQRMPHAFARGREIWQRIPSLYPGDVGPSGLVHRLPIVQRKGPSMKRTLQPWGKSSNNHNRDVVVENLALFAQNTLDAEIRRLLNVT